MSATRYVAKRTPPKRQEQDIRPERADSHPGVSVESLIRQLAAHARAASAGETLTAGDSEPKILIDTEVDGVRCVLVRKNESKMSQTSFSPREREIARMVAIGHPNKAIAAVLEISSWTVCTHLRRIFAKLGVSSRAAMVARMMQHGSWREEGLTNDSRVAGTRASNGIRH
jgi:DNA-binding CsgD family transcriptional regulator